MQLYILYKQSNNLLYVKKLLTWKKYFNLNFIKFMHKRQAQYKNVPFLSLFFRVSRTIDFTKIIVKVSKKVALKSIFSDLEKNITNILYGLL